MLKKFIDKILWYAVLVLSLGSRLFGRVLGYGLLGLALYYTWSVGAVGFLVWAFFFICLLFGKVKLLEERLATLERNKYTFN